MRHSKKIAPNATEPMVKGQTKTGQQLGIKDYTDAKVQADLKDEKGHQEGLKRLRERENRKPGWKCRLLLEGAHVGHQRLDFLVFHLRVVSSRSCLPCLLHLRMLHSDTRLTTLPAALALGLVAG